MYGAAQAKSSSNQVSAAWWLPRHGESRQVERPALDDAQEYVQPGEALVVWRLNHPGRRLPHLIATAASHERQRGVAALANSAMHWQGCCSRRCIADRRLSGGSDGDRLREIDATAPPLVPILYSERMVGSLQRRGTGRYAPGNSRCRIPEECWPDIVERAQHESLRSIAGDFGASHETIRTVLKLARRE